MMCRCTSLPTRVAGLALLVILLRVSLSPAYAGSINTAGVIAETTHPATLNSCMQWRSPDQSVLISQ